MPSAANRRGISHCLESGHPAISAKTISLFLLISVLSRYIKYIGYCDYPYCLSNICLHDFCKKALFDFDVTWALYWYQGLVMPSIKFSFSP